uniref:hypothetical protein n=1 Tax=Prevotella sp. TaxID=59823 RepID=UPI004026A53F
ALLMIERYFSHNITTQNDIISGGPQVAPLHLNDAADKASYERSLLQILSTCFTPFTVLSFLTNIQRLFYALFLSLFFIFKT